MQYNFSCALFRICMTSCKSEGRHKGNVEAPFREEMLLLLIGCDGHTSGFFCQSETFQSKFHYWTSPRGEGGGGRCHMGNSQAAVTWLVFARLSRREEGFRRQVCVRRKAAVLFHAALQQVETVSRIKEEPLCPNSRLWKSLP